MMTPVNNITRLLDSKKILYQAFELPAEKLGAEETARLLGVEPMLVYKTIVVLREEKGKKPLLVMVAADREIDLKKLAASVGEKKLHIAKHDEAEKLTGLQVGGISAVALLSKPFEVCLDRTALNFEHIHISGGQRGLDVKLGVKDLIALTKAKTIEAT